MKVRLQRRKSCYGKYTSISITLPKQILEQASPRLKKQRVVGLEVDMLGRIIISP